MEQILPQNPFNGSLAAEYDLLRLMCPNSIKLAAMIGDKISHIGSGPQSINGFEIGCGTGICTHYLFKSNENINLTAVDNSSHMLSQAKHFVASNYAIHNFDNSYRQQTLSEILRILKPGGIFINGDRYAFDDTIHQLKETQQLIREWFRLFKKIDRIDLLEDWVAHLLSDESPHILMRFNYSINQLKELGFNEINVDFREGVDTLIRAYKPSRA